MCDDSISTCMGNLECAKLIRELQKRRQLNTGASKSTSSSILRDESVNPLKSPKVFGYALKSCDSGHASLSFFGRSYYMIILTL